MLMIEASKPSLFNLFTQSIMLADNMKVALAKCDTISHINVIIIDYIVAITFVPLFQLMTQLLVSQ